MDTPTLDQLREWAAQAGHPLDSLRPRTVILVRDAALEQEYSKANRHPSWVVLMDGPDKVRLAQKVRTCPTPSELRKNSAAAKGGVAIMAPGFYRDCWRRGFHMRAKYGNQRPCLRQVGQIKVYRDGDGDSIPEWSRTGKLHLNASGVNLHDDRGSSAGCPIVPRGDHPALMAEIDAMTDNPGDLWDLLLLEPLLTCES